VTFQGKVEESGPERKEGFDKFFQMDLVSYKTQAFFSQVIKTSGHPTVTGELEFATCNEEMCLPPDYVAFAFDLSKEPGFVSGAVVEQLSTSNGALIEGEFIDQMIPSIVTTYQEPLGDCADEGEETAAGKSLIWTFVLGFLGGLLALLTPCVFPMIPLTVSYFSKDTKRKGWVNGAIYGASIIVIYVAIGLLITGVFGATALNELSTNWIANSLFFLVFVLFAFSFFGFYEITLPSSWTNKSDRMADKGGWIGIFFMAFTLALVSFSCTGPIIGSALVESATNKLGPFVVMLGFSTALALPFGLFAAFPAWLNTLPRSGSWMNSVKVVLGFLELALAFKFLSVADMTSHWNVLRYEIFLGIWVVIAAAIAAYLFGWIKFPHDSPLKKLSLPRLGLALGFAALAAYMVTGFLPDERSKTYNSLAMLSGLAPPAHYNFFKPVPDVDADIKAKYPSYSKCANNLDCFHDYYEGVAYAQEVNKPVFLDFTGYGCVNCRKTEEHIWVRDKVWQRLNNDFVMVSLYVDDREPLDPVLISKSRQEKLRNVGRKWADFQIVNFAQNTQPLYVIMTPEGEVLTAPRGYRESAEGYVDFLECGLRAFENSSSLLGAE
jgi:thiol:disulfide interchange protein DsbD